MNKTIDQYPPRRINPYIAIMVTVPALFLTVWVLFYLNMAIQWLKDGHWYILLWAVIPALFIASVIITWKGYKAWDIHHLKRREQQLHHTSLEHHHLALRAAINNGYSVEVVKPDGEVLKLTSPLTIPQPGRTVVQPVQQGQQLLASPGYPSAPTFQEIRSQIWPGHLPLAYNLQGPIIGGFDDLLSMLLGGKPGTGKSTGILYYLALLLDVKATVQVFDPQGALSAVAEYIPYYGEFSEFADPIEAAYAEITERERLYRKGQREFDPFLVLVDELPMIAAWEQKEEPEYSLLELTRKIVTQNRKHRVYCLLSGQSFPAEVLPTITRDNCSSRVIFNSSEMHARMAGLDTESRKKLLPLLRAAKPGTAILDVSRRPQPEIVALPYTTVDDIRAIVNTDRLDVEQSDFMDESDIPDAVQSSPRLPLNRPIELLDVTSGRCPKRLDATETQQFIAAYKSSGSMDKALGAINRGSAYRDHARDLIRAHNLKKG